MPEREWLYSTLDGLLTIPVHPSGKLKETPEKPFCMYRITSALPSLMGDDDITVRSVGAMVFIHDVFGDYLQIESLLGQIRQALHNATNTANGVLRCRWVEDSEDLRDDDLGTILRYSRYQLQMRP